MKRVLFIIAYSFIILSCNKKDLDTSNRALLHEKFNGKYELVSSVSATAVDLNNDGTASKNLLDENSMMMFSSIEIRIPQEPELYLNDNEFVFSEYWPTENDHRLQNNEVIPVYKTPVYSGDYDIYVNTVIGIFEDGLKSGAFPVAIKDDGKNTLIELKSIDIMENETIKVTVIRKLFTPQGWVISEIESRYKRYTILT